MALEFWEHACCACQASKHSQGACTRSWAVGKPELVPHAPTCPPSHNENHTQCLRSSVWLQLLRVMRVGKVLRMLRIYRLLRVSRLPRVLERIEGYLDKGILQVRLHGRAWVNLSWAPEQVQPLVWTGQAQACTRALTPEHRSDAS